MYNKKSSVQCDSFKIIDIENETAHKFDVTDLSFVEPIITLIKISLRDVWLLLYYFFN